LLLRLADGGARPQPTDHGPVVAVPRFVGLLLDGEGERRPDLGIALEEEEIRRHHADDRVGRAVEPQVLAHGLVAAGKEPLPQGVAQDDLVLGADLAVFRAEQAAAQRLGAEEREKGRRDAKGRDPGSRAFAAERQAAVPVHGDLLERGHVAEPVVIVRHAGGAVDDARLRVAVVDQHHAARIGERQRPQQHGIHHREDRGIGADADDQGQQRGEREALVLPQQPAAELQVLESVAHGMVLVRRRGSKLPPCTYLRCLPAGSFRPAGSVANGDHRSRDRLRPR
jgi:hypothetical protein